MSKPATMPAGGASSPRRNSPRRQRTAHHEAGHAVVAILLRLPFTSVVLRSHGRLLGWVEMGAPPRRLRSSTARVAYVMSHVHLSLAGAVAEQIQFGAFLTGGCARDMRDALRLLKLASILTRPKQPDLTTVVARQLLDHCFVTTLKLLSSPRVRRAVRSLAAVLIERGHLTRVEVLRLIRECGRTSKPTLPRERSSHRLQRPPQSRR
jgi:hypothetical protein